MDDRLAFLRQRAEALPLETTFEHRHERAQGEVALQYWPRRDGSQSSPEQLTLFVLGNPGLLNYYTVFLNHLHSLLPSSHAILATSHIGHTPGLKFPTAPLDVPAHLESKIELVQALRTYLDDWSNEAEGPRPRLALMGHSFGAYLNCEVMKRVGDAVYAGYVLFPSLGWLSQTWNGKALGHVVKPPIPWLLGTMSVFLRPVLPITTFPPTTLSLLRSPTAIRHMLTLVTSEMKCIREPDLEWFKSQRKEDSTQGLFGAWSAGKLDGWVGREGPMVQEALGPARVASLEGIPHAFCLSQEHSEIVARTVAGWVDPSRKPPGDTVPHDRPSLVAEALPL